MLAAKEKEREREERECASGAHFVSAVAFSQVICDNDSSPARKRERATFRSHCLGSWLVRFDLGHTVPDIPDR